MHLGRWITLQECGPGETPAHLFLQALRSPLMKHRATINPTASTFRRKLTSGLIGQYLMHIRAAKFLGTVSTPVELLMVMPVVAESVVLVV